MESVKRKKKICFSSQAVLLKTGTEIDAVSKDKLNNGNHNLIMERIDITLSE